MIRFPCACCGCTTEAHASRAGAIISCDMCHTTLRVPIPANIPSPIPVAREKPQSVWTITSIVLLIFFSCLGYLPAIVFLIAFLGTKILRAVLRLQK